MLELKSLANMAPSGEMEKMEKCLPKFRKVAIFFAWLRHPFFVAQHLSYHLFSFSEKVKKIRIVQTLPSQGEFFIELFVTRTTSAGLRDLFLAPFANVNALKYGRFSYFNENFSWALSVNRHIFCLCLFFTSFTFFGLCTSDVVGKRDFPRALEKRKKNKSG